MIRKNAFEFWKIIIERKRIHLLYSFCTHVINWLKSQDWSYECSYCRFYYFANLVHHIMVIKIFINFHNHHRIKKDSFDTLHKCLFHLYLKWRYGDIRKKYVENLINRVTAGWWIKAWRFHRWTRRWPQALSTASTSCSSNGVQNIFCYHNI